MAVATLIRVDVASSINDDINNPDVGNFSAYRIGESARTQIWNNATLLQGITFNESEQFGATANPNVTFPSSYTFVGWRLYRRSYQVSTGIYVLAETFTDKTITLTNRQLISYFGDRYGNSYSGRLVAVYQPATFKIKVTVPVGVASVIVKIGDKAPQTVTTDAEIEYTNGSGYEIYANPAKGYTVNYSANNPLVGSFLGADFKPEIIATAVIYTVTLNPNYTGGATTTVQARVNQVLPKTTPPTRVGYKFQGYWNASGTTQYYDANGNGITNWTYAGNATIFAHWTANTYTIKYYVDGVATSLSPSSYTYGTATTLPTPTKTGYTFNGWSVNSDLSGTLYTSMSATASGNKTFYAHWTANTYTITLDPNYSGGTPTTVQARLNQVLPSITPPTRVGYVFKGYWNQAGTNQYYDENGTGIKNWTYAGTTTLLAHWEEILFNVTLDVSHIGGASVSPSTIQVRFGHKYGLITKLPEPTLNYGQKFIGWYTEKDNSGVLVTDDTIVERAENHTLYAKWKNRPTYHLHATKPSGINGTYSYATGYSARFGSFTDQICYEGLVVKVYATAEAGYYYPYNSESNCIEFTRDESGRITILKPTGISSLSDLVTVSDGIRFTPTAEITTRELELVVGPLISSISYKLGSSDWASVTSTAKVSANVGTAYLAYPIPKPGYKCEDTLEKPASGTIAASGSRYEPEVVPDRFMVAFDPQGGVFTSISDALQAVDFGSAYSAFPSVRNRGMTFGGWYTDPVGGTRVDEGSVMNIPNNATLYAHWI